MNNEVIYSYHHIYLHVNCSAIHI